MRAGKGMQNPPGRDDGRKWCKYSEASAFFLTSFSAGLLGDGRDLQYEDIPGRFDVVTRLSRNLDLEPTNHRFSFMGRQQQYDAGDGL